MPNGGRINVGHHGNTAQATASPLELVQVLSPNGLEKFEEGQQVLITWRSAGLTPNRPVLLVNAGGSASEIWQADNYQTIPGSTGTISEVVDRSAVSDAAPAAVYQSFTYAHGGPGSRIAYHLPVPDGSYQLRLHFVEPSYTTAGNRVMDIFLQGDLVADNYDLVVASGGRLRATAESFSGTATGGSGILLELVNVTSYGAILAGLELLAP